jgi:hypothetical protein
MGKLKKAKKGVDKAALKAQKKAKTEKKAGNKEVKKTKAQRSKSGGGKDEVMDEADLIRTLEEYREKWAAEHKVSGASRFREVR